MKSYVCTRTPAPEKEGVFHIGTLYQCKGAGAVILCATIKEGKYGAGIIVGLLPGAKAGYRPGDEYHMGARYNVDEFIGTVTIENGETK